MLGLGSESFAVDIGSNDGTLLKGWARHGIPFLGVDPSGDPVRIANEQGLTTWHAFFNEETGGRIIDEHGKADAITACGCFAHISALDSIMKGIVKVLAPDGVFASDNQYWLDMVQRLHYDNAFHQHLRYYSLKPLEYLFAKYGLEVFDVERSDTYGGQIRVYGCHAGAHNVQDRVHELRAVEDEAKLYEPETQERYTLKVEEKRRVLFDTVYALKKAGKKIIGIGAPAKASTVCTYCGLGAQHLDYITEINPLRVGTYLPGAHIPILDESVMFEDPEPADAGVLFAWNYADEVIPKLRERGWQGEIILP
jgi:SAM-dependent methyltransferase